MMLVGYFRHAIADMALRVEVMNLHKLTGITILILMLLRAGWTWTHPKPSLPFGTPTWQIFCERVVHILLYVCIIAMPVVGWMGSVSEDKAPHLFHWQLMLPLQHNKALSDFYFSIHGVLAIVIIVLVSIHVLAALYHHIILRDTVLMRMMPGSKIKK